MRELTSLETENISGGNQAVAFILGGVTCFVGMYVISGLYNWITGRCKTLYEAQPYTYTLTVPVYDAYGGYMGVVDETHHEVEYVPVTVCA